MARSFSSASSQYLSRTSGAGQSFSNWPITLSCWFRAANATTDSALIGFNSDGRGVNHTVFLYALGSVSGDPVATYVQTGNEFEQTQSTSGFTSGKWHHVCGVFTSRTSRTIYLDGGSSSTGTKDLVPSFEFLSGISIGSRYDDEANVFTLFCDGEIAEAVAWRAALSVGEVKGLSNGVSPLGIRPNLLRAYWPLGGWYGQSDRDRWRNGFNLTAVNSPTWTEHIRTIYPQPAVWPNRVYTVTISTLTVSNAVVNFQGQTSLLTVSRSVGAIEGSVNLTGQDVSLGLSRSLAVSHVSLSLSGQYTGLTVARSLAVDNAVTNLSGQVAIFNVGKALTVGSGELQFTGQSVNLAAQRNLPVAHASIVLSGQSVSMGLATQQNLTVSNASTETQGQQVTLRLTKSLFVLPAEIQTSGQITQLTVARKLMVQNGEVNLAGQDVVVRRRYELGIVGGQAAFSGEGVGLLPSRKILSAEGQIQLLGQFVTAYPVLKNAKQIFTAQLLLVTQLSDDLSFVKTLEGDSGLTLRSDQDLLLANKITGSLRLIQEITR